jgi:hypothetical protein
MSDEENMSDVEEYFDDDYYDSDNGDDGEPLNSGFIPRIAFTTRDANMRF